MVLLGCFRSSFRNQKSRPIVASFLSCVCQSPWLFVVTAFDDRRGNKNELVFATNTSDFISELIPPTVAVFRRWSLLYCTSTWCAKIPHLQTRVADDQHSLRANESERGGCARSFSSTSLIRSVVEGIMRPSTNLRLPFLRNGLICLLYTSPSPRDRG